MEQHQSVTLNDHQLFSWLIVNVFIPAVHTIETIASLMQEADRARLRDTNKQSSTDQLEVLSSSSDWRVSYVASERFDKSGSQEF